MQLIPILPTLAENTEFLQHPACAEFLPMSIAFFEKVGYNPPWIGYYAQLNGQYVGSGAFKGAPANGRVEIAYTTFDAFRQHGIGTEICRALVALATQADPTITITARTLPERNFSTRILEKNGFAWTGTVMDEEDGEVWEWQYQGRS